MNIRDAFLLKMKKLQNPLTLNLRSLRSGLDRASDGLGSDLRVRVQGRSSR